MGKYTDSLFKRKNKLSSKLIMGVDFAKEEVPADAIEVVQSRERLVSCAIIRNQTIHSGYFNHADIRRYLGDTVPYESTPGDIEGFLTNRGRFVDRREAIQVGFHAGQCQVMGRNLLSSDINWNPRE